MTKVVNVRNESCEVYIGRAGRGCDGYFGNPFRLEAGESRGSAIDRYRRWFYERLVSDTEFKQRVQGLRGKTLGCFCKPDLCHGDVIKEYLDGLKYRRNADGMGADLVGIDGTSGSGSSCEADGSDCIEEVMPFNRWWYSADFATMERVTGYRQYDFDPDEGYQAFVNVCDRWWEELSIGDKVDLWKRHE